MTYCPFCFKDNILSKAFLDKILKDSYNVVKIKPEKERLSVVSFSLKNIGEENLGFYNSGAIIILTEKMKFFLVLTTKRQSDYMMRNILRIGESIIDCELEVNPVNIIGSFVMIEDKEKSLENLFGALRLNTIKTVDEESIKYKEPVMTKIKKSYPTMLDPFINFLETFDISELFSLYPIIQVIENFEYLFITNKYKRISKAINDIPGNFVDETLDAICNSIEMAYYLISLLNNKKYEGG